MSKIKYFLLFCRNGKEAPRMYKTKATVERHIKQNPDLHYQQFTDVTLFEKRLREVVERSTGGASQVKTGDILQSESIRRNVIKQRTSTTQAFTVDEDAQTRKWKQFQRSIGKEESQLFEGFKPATLLRVPLPSEMVVYFDGSSRGNPGPSGIGYIAAHDNEPYFTQSLPIGNRTNNQAEFTSLLWCMADCMIKNIPRVQFLGDSKLVVQAMRRNWKIVNAGLLPYFNACLSLEPYFQRLSYHHIPRELNKDADKLALEGSRYKLY